MGFEKFTHIWNFSIKPLDFYFITHQPDLPLFFGSDSQLVGLDLWNSIIGKVIIESLICIVGVYLYIAVTKAKNKTGNYSL